jgi:hypothetical protein
MTDVEEGRRDPKDIALAVFRFRARRGVGVFYTLFCIVPLLQAILTVLSTPNYVTQISIIAALILIYVVARLAGFQRFSQMSAAIDLYEGRQEDQRLSKRLTKILREGLVTPILPIIAIGVILVVGANSITIPIAGAFLALALYVNLKARSIRSKDRILPRRLQDWLVISSLPLIVVLVVFGLPLWVTMAVVMPIWLGAGIKSLLDAPQELVRN